MSYTYTYPRPAVTVDAVVFRIADQNVPEVLLIKRGHEPFKNKWALPGGFIDMDETAEQAVKRELFEETGIELDTLKQLKTFSAIDRDPRHRTISIVFYGELTEQQSVLAGDDASDAQWFRLESLPPLAFDHDEVLELAVRKWRSVNNKNE